MQVKRKCYEEISPMAYAQFEFCDGGFGAEKFLFVNYVFVNNKYVQGKKINLSDESYLEALIVFFFVFTQH